MVKGIMREITLILLVALVATWIAVPPGSPTPPLIGGGEAPLPDLDQVVEGDGGRAWWNPYNWVASQLWRAVYALEGIGF